MLADNELSCQKAENYSTPITVLHHGALMEAVEIIWVQVQTSQENEAQLNVFQRFLETRIHWAVKFDSSCQTVLNWLILSLL